MWPRGRAPQRSGGLIRWLALLSVIVVSHHTAHHQHWQAPAWFYPQALCVHDGWHYRRVWGRGRASYVFGRVRLVRTRKTWSNGEGAWDDASSTYGGGLQFTLSTWHRGGGGGSSTSAIAAASPREQIYRAWRIVVGQDHGNWREWPGTSRACGLR